jgi:hypothetical protein
MPVRRVESHPYVLENVTRVALTRGPLVYCVEGVDHPGIDVRQLVVSPDAALTTREQPDVLGGVVVIQGTAQYAPLEAAWQGQLYQTAGVASQETPRQPVPFTAVPYHAWANREPAPMLVWLRTTV